MRNVLQMGFGLAMVFVLLGSTHSTQGAEGIEGKWKVVAIEQGGKPFPGDLGIGGEAQVEFAGGKVRHSLMGKVLFEADYVVDEKKSPKSYEMRMKDRKGRDKQIKGIYEINGKGQLRICFRDGNNEASPTSFDTKANAGAQLTVYERVK